MVERILTHINVSAETFNMLHFLEQPFETHDQALNRILKDYRQLSSRITVLEDLILKEKRKKNA